MLRRTPNEDDAYVERLAQKLDTVPPRRDGSGIFPRSDERRAARGGDERGPRRVRAAAGADLGEVSGLDEPFDRR